MKAEYKFIKTWWSKKAFAKYFRKSIFIEFYDYDFQYVGSYSGYYNNKAEDTEVIKVYVCPSFNMKNNMSKLRISKVQNDKTKFPEFYMGHN